MIINILLIHDKYGYLKGKEYLENNNLKVKYIISKEWYDIIRYVVEMK